MDKVKASAWMMAVALSTGVVMLGIPWVMQQTQPTERIAQIQSCSVELGRIEQITSLQGVVRYEGEYAAVAPAAGVVQAVYVSAGDRVQKGQALFRMEDSVQTAAMTSALMQEKQGNAVTESASPVLMQAAAWEHQQAASTAALAMDKLTVRAASDGVIQKVYVTELGGVAAGTPGVAVSSDRQEIQCQAVVKDAQMIRTGMNARILYDGECLASGTVSAVGAAEATAGQSLCPVSISLNEQLDLPLGANVVVEVIRHSVDNVPVLPVSALDSDDTVRWIADGRSYTTKVQVLLADEMYCWVDMPIGTRVVVGGESTVAGQKIREAAICE